MDIQKKTKIRIMHTADVHLDSPFSRLSVEKGEIRRRELRGVFTSMMMYAKAHKTDIVLISGDLFDVGYAGEQTLSLIIHEFEKMPECKFVISPGNHDPFTQRSAYNLKSFPDNVYVFTSPTLSKFTFSDLGVDVYGWAFTSDHLEKNLLAGNRAEQNGNIPLLCAHCDITSQSSVYAPVSVDDIENFGAAYSALGHIHRHNGIMKFPDGNAYGYSGCPEGRSFDETGDGGAYIADIEKTPSGYLVNANFVKFSQRSYQTARLDLTAIPDAETAREKITDLIRELRYDNSVSLRLTLSGRCGAACTGLDLITAEELGLFSLEIKDKTTPSYDTAGYEQDMTLRGAFYRVLLPLLNSEDEEQRETARKALAVGFAALDGSDITR